MALLVIDYGQRIATPVEAVFNRRGVEATSATKASHDSAGLETKVDADGDSFAQLLDSEPKPRPREPDTTYSPSSMAPAKPHTVKAAQIMTQPVHSIPHNATFYRVWQRMQELAINHLMVSENDRTVGIISRGDVLEQGKTATISINDHYSRQLIGAGPDTDVALIAASFIEYRIDAMPIFNEQNQLVGIVCRSDLLRLLIRGSQVERWA